MEKKGGKMFENMIGALVVDIALDAVNFVAGCPWKVHTEENEGEM